MDITPSHVPVDLHTVPHRQRPFNYRTINHALLVILVVLSAYIMFIPFVPELTAVYARATDKTHGYRYTSALAKQAMTHTKIKTEALKPIPTDNVLVIPQIGVDAVIVEGTGPEALDRGPWRRPHTSTPDKGGNTVITGHRFLYSAGPETFYHLDRLVVGDAFFVYWEGKEYDYEVIDIYVVGPGDTQIEDPTPDPILTLYTCTPLWSASQRLVVRARLIR